MSECAGDVAAWMRSNRLQLNEDKTEVHNKPTDATNHGYVRLIEYVLIAPATDIRDLGMSLIRRSRPVKDTGSGIGLASYAVIAAYLRPMHSGNSLVKFADDTYLIVIIVGCNCLFWKISMMMMIVKLA